jgi:hypothetical protein
MDIAIVNKCKELGLGICVYNIFILNICVYV